MSRHEPFFEESVKEEAPVQTLVSPLTKLVEVLANTTHLPSELMLALRESPSPWRPLGPTETRVVDFVCRSWTKISFAAFESPATKLADSLSKATKRPEALMTGASAPPTAWVPKLLTVTS